MLSLILYGRNDSYGYNLHKRAALSLNCLAELLTADGDEILFVDYNTPDDYPTFPEAIRDTLTARAQRLLRILRVRPAQHARFRDQTRLAALEPVARNVALRRSNPENRWILSTNTDIILVPRGSNSLSDIVADIDDALYHIPRFEIPESLWESLDRMDPAGTIAEIGGWGWDLHLNEIVRMAPVILYDGPGDFQLVPRADLFRIDGFDERMLLGWHVDSNLARRLAFLHGTPRSLVDRLFGYHCDHMRQVTPAHRHDRSENDWAIFVNNVAGPDLPAQADTWGLAGEAVEEIRLDGGARRYAESLRAVIGERLKAPTEIVSDRSTYGKIGYDARHVLPFLVDAVCSHPLDTTIGWFGAERSLLDLFMAAWQRLGFTGAVMIPADAGWLVSDLPGAFRPAPFRDITQSAALFIFDFGQPVPEQAGDTVTRDARRRVATIALCFRRLVEVERTRIEEKKAPRRFVAVNVVHGPVEPLIRSHLGAAVAPIASRLRQGFVLPAAKGPQSLISSLNVGEAGRREGSAIVALPGKDGFVFFGGYRDLFEGRYRVRVLLRANAVPTDDSMVLEVIAASYYLAFCPVTENDLKRGEVALEFTVWEELLRQLMALGVEFRLITTGEIAARITDVTLEHIAGGAKPADAAVNWLPLMYVGRACTPHSRTAVLDRLLRRAKLRGTAASPRATAAGVTAVAGIADFVVFGPYATLLPGRYCLEVDFGPSPGERGAAAPSAPGRIRLDVFSSFDEVLLAEAVLASPPPRDGQERLEFSVPDRLDNTGKPMRLEFRVWSDGAASFMVRAVRTWPLAHQTAAAGEEERAVSPLGS